MQFPWYALLPPPSLCMYVSATVCFLHRFVGKMNRIDAEQCLHRMKDGVFLIRESAARRGEYAIALRYVQPFNMQLSVLQFCNNICRWYGMPKHIKICKHPETRKFYVADVCDFHSVWVSDKRAYHFHQFDSVCFLLTPSPILPRPPITVLPVMPHSLLFSPPGAGRVLSTQFSGHQFPENRHYTQIPI